MNDELFTVYIPGDLPEGEKPREFAIPAAPRPTYSTYDVAQAAAAYELDCAGELLTVVKVKTHRWLLCKENGTVVASKRYEHEVLAQAGKIEVRRLKGNLHGFRFGSRITADLVMQHAKQVWADRFSYSNIEFDGHYWWADIADPKTGAVAERLRLDYHINYERLPEFAVKAV